jgi:hypothetical protein
LRSRQKQIDIAPKQNLDHACETGCLTTRKDGNKEVHIHGAKYLAEFGLSEQLVAEHSYENHFRNRNAYVDPSHLMGWNGNGIQGVNVFAMGSHSTPALPVSVSENLVVGDVTPRGKPNLPCTCDDWTGNETQPFLSEIELEMDQSDFKTGMAAELFEKICACPFHYIPSLLPGSRSPF